MTCPFSSLSLLTCTTIGREQVDRCESDSSKDTYRQRLFSSHTQRAREFQENRRIDGKNEQCGQGGVPGRGHL